MAANREWVGRTLPMDLGILGIAFPSDVEFFPAICRVDPLCLMPTHFPSQRDYFRISWSKCIVPADLLGRTDRVAPNFSELRSLTVQSRRSDDLSDAERRQR